MVVCRPVDLSKGQAFAGKISLAIANKKRYYENGYSAARLKAPVRSGGKGKVFENLAVSSQHSAFSQ
jgi:hypothetical protein